LIEKHLDLDFGSLIDQAVALQPVQGERVADDIYEYVMERLRAYYLDSPAATPESKPITTEMFDAVLATQPRSPLDFDARLRALSAFLDMPEATSLAAANKRIANILRKSDNSASAEVDVEVLREPAEVRLFDAIRGLRESVATATARREYAAALGQLAQLRPAVDGFFDQVMVMAEDPKLRANRLALLSGLRSLFGGVAALSRLPG
jgi:glycyl-tRNA synthetase beta chain